MSNNELKSIDSNSLEEQPRFAFDQFVWCMLFVFVTIGLVVFELFVILLHFGSVRPIWAYILWGSIATILVVCAVFSLMQLAQSNWRLSADQKRTNAAYTIMMWSLFGVFHFSYHVLPFKNQSDLSVSIHLLAGIGIGFSVGVLLISVLSFFFGPLITWKERGTAE